MKALWVPVANAPFDALRFDQSTCELEIKHGDRVWSHSLTKPSLMFGLLFGPDRSVAYDELKKTSPGVERVKVGAR